MALIHPAELGRAVVADHIAGLANAFALHDIGLGLVEFDRLGILQGGDLHHIANIIVERRLAHAHYFSQFLH